MIIFNGRSRLWGVSLGVLGLSGGFYEYGGVDGFEVLVAGTDNLDIVLFENGYDLFLEVAVTGWNKKDHAMFE